MPITLYLVLSIELLIVSYLDLRTKKISNWWSLLNIINCFYFYTFYPTTFKFSWQIFLIFAGLLGVGFILFSLRIMGGGDAKFLSTFFLQIPYHLHHLTLYYLLVSTVVAAAGLLIFKMMKQKELVYTMWKTRDISFMKSFLGTKFSYAPVILLSWVLLGISGHLA